MDKGKLSETVLVHCTDVRVLLERLYGETKLEFGIVRCGKGFPKCALVLFINVKHTLHNLSHRLILFRMDVAEIPFHDSSAWLPNHIIIFRRFGPLLSSKSCLHSYVWLIWKPPALLLALARTTAVLFFNLLKSFSSACAYWTSTECLFWERFWNSTPLLWVSLCVWYNSLNR